jgi:hypothetical protein
MGRLKGSPRESRNLAGMAEQVVRATISTEAPCR